MKDWKRARLNIILHILIASGYSCMAAVINDEPLLICAIMIKNEAPVIEKTLQSMVDGGIDSFLIFDTGSTDTTIAVVQDYFNNHSITNYVIEQGEFVDFATSRNRALDLVDQHFPKATFIFMPDAEWILHNGHELIAFCKEHKHDLYTSFLIRLVQQDTFEFDVDRLIRRSSHVRFRFPVHEYLEVIFRSKIPESIFIEYKPTRYGSEKSQQRFKRDLQLLLKEYAKNPQEPRVVYYLAQTYESLGDWENARRFYELRTQINGCDEENFIALCRLARAIEIIAENDTKKESPYDWALAEWYYLKAFSVRSSRIEPLIHLAQHYLNNGDFALAYLFASRATSISYPHNDILFVEKEFYTFTRYDILGRCAWYIGEFEAGEWALNKAIAYHPDYEYLQNNIKFYLERKNTLNGLKEIK